MAYFDCIVGGSGGKWKLTVTCTSVFAGLTITCTDGTTTLTKACPSSSPYTVVFNIPNGGTWTISGVYGGKTNTTTVVIPDTATLSYIPTGSTVTPTNDIQTWLHCANIWDKSYTTINQVLADTSTLLALISSNNAADYMARSTNWASSVCANATAMGYIGNNNYCANKLLDNSTWRTSIAGSTYFESVLNVKIPVMTSNTAPSGVASSSGQYAGQPFNAFMGDTRSCYISPVNTGWLQYKFPNTVDIYKMTINCSYGSGSISDGTIVNGFDFKRSSDGSTFNDVYTATNISTSGIAISNYSKVFSKATGKYFRWANLKYKSANYGYMAISNVNLYGRLAI